MNRDKWGNPQEWPAWPECGAGMCECHDHERIAVDRELERPVAGREHVPDDGDLTEEALEVFGELGIEPR